MIRLPVVRFLGKRNAVVALLVAALSACSNNAGPSVPIPPSNVTATPGPGQVVVTWTDNSANEAGFRVHRAAVSGSAFQHSAFDVIATTAPNVDRYVDAGAAAGTLYRYSVSAFNDAGESSPVAQTNPPVERGQLHMALNVQVAGAGSGRVTSDPAGIDCGSDCHETFDAGTSVVLTAVPAEGSRFVEWAGDCSGDDLQCEVVVSDNLFVVASFMPVSLPPGEAIVSVAKAGDGAGLVVSDPDGISCGEECDATFTVGQLVTLSAEASPTSSFLGWSGSGCSGMDACVIEATSAHLVTATFEAIRYELSVEAEGAGTIKSSPAGIDCGSECSTSFPALSTVTLTTTPSTGQEFVGWSGACSGTNASCLVEMTENRAVMARFGERRIVVTSTSGGTGGPNCTLRDAITAANTDAPQGGCRAGSGHDVIELPANGRISLYEVDNTTSGNNGLPSITSPMTIRGNGSTIERGLTEEKFRIFHIGAGGQLTIQSVTVANGHGMRLGGGGFLLDAGQATVVGSVISGNVADIGVESLGAGILNLRGSLVVEQTTLTRNGLENSSHTHGPSSGAAIAVVDGTATITSSSLARNLSENVGGVHSLGASSTVTITSSTISGNAGKAIDNEGSIWLTDVELVSNNLETASGGITNSGSAYLDRVTFQEHMGEYTGTLVNKGHMEIVDSIISNNIGLTIDGRGGISNWGHMEITRSHILDNDSHDAGGGGIWNFSGGEMTVRESVIAGNSAEGGGGGIANGGWLELVDSRVFGNWAFGSSSGGGIANGGRLEPHWVS